MRVHAPREGGYLRVSYENKVSLVLYGQADEWVVAPPELLFLYHTWRREASGEFSPRPIPREEFMISLLCRGVEP